MPLRALTRFAGGNAAAIRVRQTDEESEVYFAPSPHGGPETLWFHFRLTESKPDESHPDRVSLTLRFFRNILGNSNPLNLHPVYRPENSGWNRMKTGTVQTASDGQISVTWTIPYPTSQTDVALCYPYGVPEINSLIKKSKVQWNLDEIGLSQGSRPLLRVSNDYGKDGGTKPGLFLIARQHSGETPGSWVLEGILDHLARTRINTFFVWAVPLSNIDGIEYGDYGKDNFPYDLNRAWGSPPMRHETLVIQRDIRQWSVRCAPALALDFHAPGGCEAEGMYCFLADSEQNPDTRKEAEKWANVIGESLGPDFASENFKRIAKYASRWQTATFSRYMQDEIGVATLCIETPYSQCGKTAMTQKQYREAGHRIARAILRRHSNKQD